ncbi:MULTISPECIES: hypothetical protein [unclassified Endozoicomonas]|uniref:hypothetical protein n=1 Tax=unclassified Endozoicomonas TaxID=2644528 RepID=UPI003BB6551E
MELGKPELIYRSDAVLTPFEEGELCTEAINNCLEQWLEESGIDCDQLFSGGVIITGLIGARHFQFEPGTYRLLEVSNHGQQLLEQLNLQLTIGDECSQNDIDQIVRYYIRALEAMVTGDHHWFDQGDGQQLCQVAFQPDAKAGFVSLGKVKNFVIPVYFYGMH